MRSLQCSASTDKQHMAKPQRQSPTVVRSVDSMAEGTKMHVVLHSSGFEKLKVFKKKKKKKLKLLEKQTT